MMSKDIIITAGGLGRRLWPVSTDLKPKQFMSLEGDISFLQSTILRAQKLYNDGYIIVVSRHDLHGICQEQIQELTELLSVDKRQNLLDRLVLILEPFSNGTASSVLLAMHCLNQLREEDASILLLPSDHIIGPFEYFEQDVKKAFMLSPENKIVCYGIEPMYPATNYGYIEMGNQLEINKVLYEDVYLVPSFQEKPELERAKTFLEKNKYLWNTAIYTFSRSLMFDEYKKYQKKIFDNFEMLPRDFCKIDTVGDIKTVFPSTLLEKIFNISPNISFDFGITTHTTNACVIKSIFSWEDVGNWDSFSSLFTPPTEKIVEIEGKNNFIYSDIPVALCGVENLSVIIKNGEALILQKGRGELVKDAFNVLKNQSGDE
jgi:mannose-1-phosphate guanylyltransferase/mannose-6-phosphate isomerase